MQMISSNIEQGELVVADILFAEQGSKKRRLALVISNTEYNKQSRDIVVLKVTSSGEPSAYSISLAKESTVNNALKKDSRIVVDFPVTIVKQNVLSRPDRVSQELLSNIKSRIAQFYAISANHLRLRDDQNQKGNN